MGDEKAILRARMVEVNGKTLAQCIECGAMGELDNVQHRRECSMFVPAPSDVLGMEAGAEVSDPVMLHRPPKEGHVFIDFWESDGMRSVRVASNSVEVDLAGATLHFMVLKERWEVPISRLRALVQDLEEPEAVE